MNFLTELARLGRITAAEAERRIDEVKERITEELRSPEDVHLQMYRGFGTSELFHLAGRALRGRPLERARADQSLLDNLFEAYIRFESDELPEARVTARVGTMTQDAVADHEGYVHIDLEVSPDQLGEGPWHRAACTMSPRNAPDVTVSTEAEVLVPGSEASFGVISDIDDTVLVSGATNLLSLGRLTLLGNARTRLPFTGVDGFYRALATGPDGERRNPFFYVSSSPHNLYDMLEDFMDHHGLPKGVILLRDLGLTPEQWFKSSHDGHKREKIERVLATYPEMEFVLVGDSGQRDPEIYAGIAREHPDRIRVVYIRDVSEGRRTEAVEALALQTAEAGVPILLTADSRVAAEDAAERGLIPADALDDVVRAFRDDTARPTPTEAVGEAVEEAVTPG